MWLRNIMPEEVTPDDIRAMTLIRYREVLLQEGKPAADASPLLLPQ